ncbi:MAG: DUF11 domain-containing protein [bacterium]|nr:DUF11 domain-containing protein [bacterium]
MDANFGGVRSVYAADVDGDGDLDVLGAAFDVDDIAWWENADQTGPGTGDGTAWVEHSVDANFDGAESVYTADVDGDGDLDVLGAAANADDIAWWENVDQTGNGTAWVEHSVDANFDGADSVYAADVDSDGDLDVLGAARSADDIVQWENANGDGTAWVEHSVDANFDGARSVYAADVDSDGDLDVLGAAGNADDITVWLNEPSQADPVLEKSFMPDTPLSGGIVTYTLSFTNVGGATASGVIITDNIPVSVAHSSLSYAYSGARITATGSISYVWQVQDLSPGDGGVITITGVLSDSLAAGISNVATISTTSMDYDPSNNSGLVTLPFAVTAVTPARNKLNVTATHNISMACNGVINAGTVTSSTLTVRGLQSGIYAGSYSFPAENITLFDPVDSFKAGEVVMVNASSQIESSDGITVTPHVWQFTVDAQHGDGDGGYWVEQVVDANFDGAGSVYAADVDGDGDLDVLGAAWDAGDIAWWENVDQTGPGSGNGTAWSEHSVDANFPGAYSVQAADVDGDGDLDVLGVAANANDIAWWENVDQTGPGSGDGTAWIERSVDADFDGAWSVQAADMDGDGDLDVLGAARNYDAVAWWENTNGDGTDWSEHSVDADFRGARSVYAADVDGDGDLDVLGAAYSADDIAWWENVDQTGPGSGDGTAWVEHSVNADFDGARSVYAADVDGDGDLDILGSAAAADDFAWWENVDQTGPGSGVGS